jgi:hypothetical protein
LKEGRSKHKTHVVRTEPLRLPGYLLRECRLLIRLVYFR